MSRLLTNLISNAYRYGKPDGHIQVRLREKETGRSTEDETAGGMAKIGLRSGKGSQNLVEHAFGQMPGQGRDEAKKSILLIVEDDGIGIAPEEQENIFRRFYQVDASRTGNGSGLGLAMVREIAQFHGGEVRVESTPGEGSVFTVQFS